MIVVLGATGTVGSQLVRQLSAAKHPVRAVVHSAAKAAGLRLPLVETVQADYTRPETLRAALARADHLFLLTATHPDQVRHEGGIIEEAKRSSVGHIVKLSVLGAQSGPRLRLMTMHRQVEQNLEACGIPWTFLRPSLFMSELLSSAALIRSEGRFHAAAGDGQVSVVHPADVAACALRALTEMGHGATAYDLTGPEALSLGQLAERLAKALGRPVAYVPLDEASAHRRLLERGVSEWNATSSIELDRAIREGALSRVSGDVQAVSGRPPRGFDEWLGENLAAFR